MDIYQKLSKYNKINIAKSLQVLVLSGGKGSRLESNRKIITESHFPTLKEHWGKEGPKSLAILNINGQSKPLLDYHLDIHTKYSVSQIYLGLGFASNIIQDYVDKVYHKNYKNIPINTLTEKNPAGTLASFIKMYKQNLLTNDPLVIANSDNILDTNIYESYLQGLVYLANNNIDLDKAVINLSSCVPHEQSNNYGLIQIDNFSNLAFAFIEKQPIDRNPFEVSNGKNICWVNSGFSIIVNALAFAQHYISNELIETCEKLESGELDYSSHEKFVKYETLFESVAESGYMVAIKQWGFWADSGSEPLIKLIEEYYKQ